MGLHDLNYCPTEIACRSSKTPRKCTNVGSDAWNYYTHSSQPCHQAVSTNQQSMQTPREAKLMRLDDCDYVARVAKAVLSTFRRIEFISRASSQSETRTPFHVQQHPLASLNMNIQNSIWRPPRAGQINQKRNFTVGWKANGAGHLPCIPDWKKDVRPLATRTVCHLCI